MGVITAGAARYTNYSLMNHDGAGSPILPTLSGKVRIRYGEYPRYRMRHRAATLNAQPTYAVAPP